MCNHNIEKCVPVPGTQLDKLNMVWRATSDGCVQKACE